jgi:hypothetical protein
MQLAQLNIARAKYPLDTPEIKNFISDLDAINAVVDISEGFIWRLTGEGDNAMDIQAFCDENIIVNMSVWSSIDSLKNFISQNHYRDFSLRIKAYFDDVAAASYVLWWQEEGVIPTVNDAIVRLEHLRRYGDSPYAFSFKVPFNIGKQ